MKTKYGRWDKTENGSDWIHVLTREMRLTLINDMNEILYNRDDRRNMIEQVIRTDPPSFDRPGAVPRILLPSSPTFCLSWKRCLC